jgi:hypothetical protein
MRVAFELFESADIAMVNFEVSQKAAPRGEILSMGSVAEGGGQRLGRTPEQVSQRMIDVVSSSHDSM